ncbi:hypothetical protein DFAR_950026 [Desulfarculales bacterium]
MDPKKITNWIHKIGEATVTLAEGIMSRRAHPQQGFRVCLGLVTLAKKQSATRVEAADLRAFRSKSVESIIDKELDEAPLLTPAPEISPNLHPNIYGADYFLTAQRGSRADLTPS